MRAVALLKHEPNLRCVRGEYRLRAGFGITHIRRSMLSARGTISAFEQRAGYEFTACEDDARARYVHERITHCLQIVTCSASRARKKCEVSAWSVLTRHLLSSTVQKAQKIQTDLIEQVLCRTVCAMTNTQQK